MECKRGGRRGSDGTEGNRVERRKVRFGNPALVTYGGYVCTLKSSPGKVFGESDEEENDLERIVGSNKRGETQEQFGRMVAMCNVPPSEVPEGVLNFVRSHRPFIQHLRIVMTDVDGTAAEEEIDGARTDDCVSGVASVLDPFDLAQSHDVGHTDCNGNASASVPVPVSSPSPVQPFEDAASILAADESRLVRAAQQKEEQKKKKEKRKHHHQQKEEKAQTSLGLLTHSHSKPKPDPEPERTYLVLISLNSAAAAQDLVNDLHGKPYTTLQKDVTASVYRVVNLEAQATDSHNYHELSLVHPFFPSNTSNATTITTTTATTSSPPSSTPKKLNYASTATTSTIPSDSPTNNTNVIANNCNATASQVANSTSSLVSTTPSIEVHNCPVCLEPMELTTTSTVPMAISSSSSTLSPTSKPIFTTVCNHSFHIECLMKWQDSPCPVCRYDHSSLNDDALLSHCHICNTTNNIYVCLICGVVSCSSGTNTTITANDNISTSVTARGTSALANTNATTCNASSTATTSTPTRPTPSASGGHARAHYDQTLHAYALDTSTQHVWDFAGQGYVHRIIQNKDDGKLVEINDPTNTTSHVRSLSPGLSDAQEGEVVHRKLEGFANQYYTLLKSQLEQQRIFYEGILEKIRQDHASGNAFSNAAGAGIHGSSNYVTKKGARLKKGSSSTSSSSTADLIVALKQDRNQLQQRCETLCKKYTKIVDDVAFLKNMNESLEANKEPMRRQITEAQREREEHKLMLARDLPPLEEKVRLLMLKLEFDDDVCDLEKKPAANVR